MAVYILEPSLTDDFIVTIFSSLVKWETKKLVGLDMEQQDGCQTGYVECLADLFGEASDDEINAAFDNGETWLQVVSAIVDETKLSDLIDAQRKRLQSSEGLDLRDFEIIEETCCTIVNEYLSTHMDIARKAIRNI
jgi:hypothetical protein